MRNRDVQKELLLFGTIVAAGTAAALFLFSWETALYVLGLSALFLSALALLRALRTRRLKRLSLDLDRLLHGDYSVRFNNYEEGENAILANELAKVTDTLKKQAEQLQKEKKYLADSIADISHQIRTPLTALDLNLATLLAGDGTEHSRRERLQQARQLTGRMEWLIEALLKLSRLDAGTIEFARGHVCLRELVEKAAEPFLIPLELRGQRLELAGIDETAGFTGDAAWSAEAVSNVLKNCMEHTGEDGLITVTGEENAIFTELVIADNGEGIAEEDLPHLFERFYRGKNSGGQSGRIGLALTRAILTAQNGTIQAENRREG
ncbi:MAG: HAMP domain-containing histidine kinase, partial [Lachnospiraceae bacterium]|nr:HAMP domain-containing histidine kinase [Lachnospiraceae bacterium]